MEGLPDGSETGTYVSVGIAGLTFTEKKFLLLIAHIFSEPMILCF
jgi:hypothetical protein